MPISFSRLVQFGGIAMGLLDQLVGAYPEPVPVPEIKADTLIMRPLEDS
jgi:hypothetical protein